MEFKTTDLCDAFEDQVHVAEPVLRDFGGLGTFSGQVATVQVFEDNVLVRSILETPGEGRVLVVDGGGSTQCALVGDQVAQIACDNGWAGLVIHGCIRDVEAVAQISIGIRALDAVPRRSRKEGKGLRDLPVFFAGVVFRVGWFLYADEDGLIVAESDLLAK
ncbi:MAG: ribonuclease E activity regulator RraA [bacterium]|nr:ribonuclease E activity regulator RraA [bacterium]